LSSTVILATGDLNKYYLSSLSLENLYKLSPEGSTKDQLLTQGLKLKIMAQFKLIEMYGKINIEHSGLLHGGN